jgi:hypothetical protein
MANHIKKDNSQRLSNNIENPQFENDIQAQLPEVDLSVLEDDEEDDDIITISRNGYILIVQCMILLVFIVSLISLLANPESVSLLVWMFFSIIAFVITSVVKDD